MRLTVAEEFETIPENSVLEAEIVDCRERETIFDIDRNDPSKGKQREVSFRFRVTEDGDWYNRQVFGRTPTTFSTHPDCKLRIWVQEILDFDELPEGFEFEPEDLVGLTTRVVIGNRPKTNQDGSITQKEYVDQVQRLSRPRDASDIF